MPVESSHAFLLDDVATVLGKREGAQFGDVTIPGRFFINGHEVALGTIEPGLEATQINYYCNRVRVPQPWPTLGDHLIIDGQDYEIIGRQEDDLGELDYRLIRQEIGLARVISDSAAGSLNEMAGPGRPTRRPAIVSAFEAALADGHIELSQPLQEMVEAIRPKLGNGQGLSDKTLRKVLLDLVRTRRGVRRHW